MRSLARGWSGNRATTVAVFLALLGGFLTMARLRLVDGDEGYYLLAAKLVHGGSRPYSDFFFPQMPLLPYVYAAGMTVVDVSWRTGRVLSGILASLLGTALYLHTFRSSGSRPRGLLGALLFATSSLGLAWYTPVKTYALTALLLFLAFMAFERGTSSRRPGWMLLGGLLAGLAIDARLLALAALGAFGWSLYCSRARARAAAAFAVGVLAGILPVLWLAASVGQVFWFDNLGYHLGRSDMSLAASLVQKTRMLLQLWGLPTIEAGSNLQVTLLVAVTLGAWYARGRVPEQGRLAFGLAVWLGVAGLFPTPVYLQYFSIVVPFLIVSALASLPAMTAWLRERSGPARLPALIAVGWLAAIAYLVPVPVDVYRFTHSGFDVPGIWGPRRAQSWTVPAIREVTRTIDHYAGPGEPVLSWWPGYLVESHARALPGVENQFGVAMAAYLGPEERARYHVLSPEEIQKGFERRETRVVVSGLSNFMSWEDRDLLAAGYTPVARVGEVDIFVATQP